MYNNTHPTFGLSGQSGAGDQQQHDYQYNYTAIYSSSSDPSSSTGAHSGTSNTIDPRLFASATTISDLGIQQSRPQLQSQQSTSQLSQQSTSQSQPQTQQQAPPSQASTRKGKEKAAMWAGPQEATLGGPQEATLAQSSPWMSTEPIPLDATPLHEALRARHERWSRHGGAMELPMATFSVPASPQQPQQQQQPFMQQSAQGQAQILQQQSGQMPQQTMMPAQQLRSQSYNDQQQQQQQLQNQTFQPAQQQQQQQQQQRGRAVSITAYDLSGQMSGVGRPQQQRAVSASRRSPGADDITIERSPAISVSQMSEVELLVAMSRTTLMSGYFTRPIEPPEWMRMLFPDEDDLHCFHHCIVYSMSIFVVKEDRNPWIEHVVPLILFPTEYAPSSTQAMRLAMLATGATHLAYLEARKAAGSPEAQRKRRLALRYRSESVALLREARHSPVELTSDAFLAATAIMLSNDMLAANSTWREIARLSRFAIHARGGCETMIKGMTVKNSGQLAVLCVLSQLLVLDLYAVLSSGEMPHLYHGEELWFEQDGEAPSMFDALLGMSSTTVVLAAQALIIWHDSFLLQARFGEAETSRLAFPPESHFIVTQPTPGALDFRITLPRHTPNLTRTYAEPGAPAELEDLARRTRLFLEKNEEWHTSDWTNTLEERTQWGSLALYIGQHIMVRRDMYRLLREDKGCQILADVLLRMCLTVGDKMQFFKWPLIIAASVFTDAPRREATRQTLKAFEYQCCYEIAVAQAVIEEMWRRADEGMDDDTCHWKRCFLELGCPVLLY